MISSRLIIVLLEIMMSKLLKVTILASTLVSVLAHADTLDLGFIKGANVFSLGDFRASGSDVEGAVIAAGNVTVSNYSFNEKNQDAFGGYALVAGGNLNYTSGSINHGNWYVGGTTTLTSFGATGGAAAAGAPAGLNFGAMAATARNVSTTLAGVDKTGDATTQWGGLFLTGTNSQVEVFDLTGQTLQSVNWMNVSGLNAGATLIFNVSGTGSMTMSGGFDAFKNYNVLFNFYEASNVNFSNIGLDASVLAPEATITGGGVITGSVIAGTWAAQTQVNTGNAFEAANVRGFALSVPEPKPWAMGLIGIALIGFVGSRRRNTNAVKFAPLPQEPSE